jgi:hypothetical protein
MKILTAAEMREVDRRTIEAGIPGIVVTGQVVTVEPARDLIVETTTSFADRRKKGTEIPIRLVRDAEDKLHRLSVELHYRSCDGGVWRTDG